MSTQKAWIEVTLRASTRHVLTSIVSGQQDDDQIPFIPKALFLLAACRSSSALWVSGWLVLHTA